MWVLGFSCHFLAPVLVCRSRASCFQGWTISTSTNIRLICCVVFFFFFNNIPMIVGHPKQDMYFIVYLLIFLVDRLGRTKGWFQSIYPTSMATLPKWTLWTWESASNEPDPATNSPPRCVKIVQWNTLAKTHIQIHNTRSLRAFIGWA